MASAAYNTSAVGPDSLITIKVSVNDSLKKLKLPLKDLGANVLPDKLRHLLNIKPEQTVVFERFSDSAGGYIVLDPNKPQVFKTLIRAAKAKLKLRLKATVSPMPEQPNGEAVEMPEEKVKNKPMEPVIVRSPTYQNSPRESAAMDGRSIGTGIFQFREARASQPLIDASEAPVPRPFSTTDSKAIFDKLVEQNQPRGLVFRTREPAVAVNNSNGHPWSVYCNECDTAMNNAHFHCNICDSGDYDLCEICVAGGKLCPGEGHWLIKRFIQDGKVISSTTERISPRSKKPAQPEPEIEKEIPGAFTDETKTLAEPQVPTRTCNSCVVVLPEREFVTCTSCADFDLCIKCHIANKHGHHPAHGFQPATEDTILPLTAEMLLSPGRNARHSAICDGCDKKILGVRHKCLNCPDWDYCSECFKNAQHIHPRHRFAPLYEPIPEPRGFTARHIGIYCDGPLCGSKSNQNYIEGIRYKCAVCHDTDFCGSCEALPSNTHNRTHPLIKFRTPVRNVSITTENEDVQGQMRYMGDHRPAPAQAATKTASTETTPIMQANAATQVQTVAEIKPTEEKASAPVSVTNAEDTNSVQEIVAGEDVPTTLLNAHFVEDTIADGTVVQPDARFTQVWTMRNPGPYAWPSGCSVRFVGGDNMLNVDNSRPAAVSDIAEASESNVIGRDVQVGEQVAFKITLKAPSREGKHISYWRMKAANGTPFGHRLWCDIEVKNPVEAVTTVPIVLPSPVGMVQAQQERQAFQSQVQWHKQQLMMAREVARKRAQAGASGPPPSYDTLANVASINSPESNAPTASIASVIPPNINAANITARIAAMREQQAKRREHMMEQYNARLEQSSPYFIKPQGMPASAKQVEQQEDDDKVRKEAARQRVEHIKAKILRAREEKAKALEADKANAMDATKEATVKENAAREKKYADEFEKVKKIIEEVTKADEQKKDEDLEGSQMVFPKLDKESPASSTYQSVASSKGKAAYVENEQGEIERSASPSVASPAPAPVLPSPFVVADYEDLDDDIEVISAGEDSEDDGFLTDEEYDILDASDHETVASQ